MTLIESQQQSVQADTGFQNLDPVPRDAGLTTPLTSMRINNSLDLYKKNNFLYDDTCALPRWWVDTCSPRYPVDGNGEPLEREDKCAKTDWQEASFAPFEFYDIQEAGCVDPVFNLFELASTTVSEATAWALTAELDHSPATGNPSFRSAVKSGGDLTSSDGKAVDPLVGLQILIRAMRQKALGRMVIHVPFEALPVMAQYVGFVGGSLRGPGNVLINTGLGFSGVGPDISGNEDSTSTGEVFFYATRGPAEYRVGPVTQYDDQVQVRHRANYSATEALRRGALRFDPGCVVAVKVCLNKVSCCG